jgi:hypothetical protein
MISKSNRLTFHIGSILALLVQSTKWTLTNLSQDIKDTENLYEIPLVLIFVHLLQPILDLVQRITEVILVLLSSVSLGKLQDELELRQRVGLEIKRN